MNVSAVRVLAYFSWNIPFICRGWSFKIFYFKKSRAGLLLVHQSPSPSCTRHVNVDRRRSEIIDTAREVSHEINMMHCCVKKKKVATPVICMLYQCDRLLLAYLGYPFVFRPMIGPSNFLHEVYCAYILCHGWWWCPVVGEKWLLSWHNEG